MASLGLGHATKLGEYAEKLNGQIDKTFIWNRDAVNNPYISTVKTAYDQNYNPATLRSLF